MSDTGTPSELPSAPADRLVCELLVAIRGKRSQAMLARRSGLGVQRIAAWERGRRAPSVSDVLCIARAARVDVDQRFAERLPALADVEDGDHEDASKDAAYVRALVQTAIGGQSAVVIARGAKIHRATLASWLRGATEPRMAELVTLFAAAHYDPSYVVSLFVDPASLASLADAWAARMATTALFEELPDAFAVLAALDTTRDGATSLAAIGRLTGLTPARTRTVLARLLVEGHVLRKGRGWMPGGAQVWLMRPARVQRFYAFLAADQTGRDPRTRRALHVGAMDAEGMRALAKLGSRFVREMQALFAEARARSPDRVTVVSMSQIGLARVAPAVHGRALERSRTERLVSARRK